MSVLSDKELDGLLLNLRDFIHIKHTVRSSAFIAATKWKGNSNTQNLNEETKEEK